LDFGGVFHSPNKDKYKKSFLLLGDSPFEVLKSSLVMACFPAS